MQNYSPQLWLLKATKNTQTPNILCTIIAEQVEESPLTNKMLRLWAYYTRHQEIIIDNPIFRIHSSFTTVLLLTFSIIITWTDLVGRPIQCSVTGVPAYMVTSYCWIETTFLMPGKCISETKETTTMTKLPKSTTNLSVGLLCTVFFKRYSVTSRNGCVREVGGWTDDPHRLWTQHPTSSRDRKELEKRDNEQLLVNIILQMVFMNWFFKGDFLLYGLKVLTFMIRPRRKIRPHDLRFPTRYQMHLRKFGPSGSIEKHDAFCILPQKNFSEKIHIFIWFWFIILAVLIAALGLPHLHAKAPAFLLYSRTRMVPKEVVDSICRRVSVGDWWILYMLGRNVDPQIYKEVITDFAEKEHTVKYIIIRIPPQCCAPTNWFLKLFYAIC
ncbi:Innexin inx1 [Orchesella cincta]|uniref:Innexin n=1 Tax=Orchesella cincta TaxID=48709 RepID=A0A1D2M7J2_ORCCI|nr:Innexin inx1 [Orchesella cincta]